MEIGMIGLGRMGSNMVRRLLREGHRCVAHDRSEPATRALEEWGATAASTPGALIEALRPPRHVWLMVPAAGVDKLVGDLATRLSPGDVVIDGGNSHYRDDVRRAALLAESGIEYVDVGTSGGIWGLENGYCLMIGGEPEVVARLEPIFASLAPGSGAASSTPGRRGTRSTADQGFLHCGPVGAGHFVKMVHNGIEYGLMAAYAEGLDILRHAASAGGPRTSDAETAPRRSSVPSYELPIPEIAELWRRGSVIRSWLLDLASASLSEDAELAAFSERVADSGEGRWTAQTAIELGAPAPVLTLALYERFSSRGESGFGRRVLSALRAAFGGHPGAHEEGDS
jgi:6-phosphogluconate dehydrogenase